MAEYHESLQVHVTSAQTFMVDGAVPKPDAQSLASLEPEDRETVYRMAVDTIQPPMEDQPEGVQNRAAYLGRSLLREHVSPTFIEHVASQAPEVSPRHSRYLDAGGSSAGRHRRNK